MSIKQKLLKLQDEENWEFFVTYFRQEERARSKSHADLYEAFDVLSRTEREALWEIILCKFIEIIKPFVEGRAAFDNNNEQDIEENGELRKQISSLLYALFNLANVQVEVLLNEKNKSIIPSKLTQFTLLLGNMLDNLKEDQLYKPAVNLCEVWILNEFESYEEILPTTLKAVLLECFSKDVKKVTVKRAFSLRTGLPSLELLMTDSQDSFREFLVPCASNYHFLSCDEGMKLLSCILVLPGIMRPFHEAVKRNLIDATKSQSVKYGEVYFRAWKNSSPDVRKEIEERCLQDLMYLAVHVDPSFARLSNNIFGVLHHIHQHKKHLPTASVIYSLYEPFLWRSLNVANGYVRTNATTILFDLYPCTDISLSAAEKEQLMTRQYNAFADLLVDPCHLVRIAAIKGVYSILTNYWLLIPANTIQKLFQILLKKLALDASSVEIRTLVVQGVSQLLDCAQAGPFVTDILPHISEAFNDVNASVRIAFVKLLLKVKATKFIKYWKLVSMEHLLNRLAIDVPMVKKLISELISSSFLPAHLSEHDKLERCISLLKMNREGVRNFFHCVSKKMDIEVSTRFIVCIWDTLGKYVHASHGASDSTSSKVDSPGNNRSARTSRKQRRLSKSGSQNKENVGDESDDLGDTPLDDPQIVGGLLDVLAILWAVNGPRLALEQNLKYLQSLRTRVSRSFPSVWAFFKDNDEISKTLLYLSSFLPKSHVPLMISLSLSRLKDMTDSQVNAGWFGTYVNALCNWDRIPDLIEITSDGIDAAFASTEPQTKAVKKGVCFDVPRKPQPILGLQILGHILSHSLNRLSLLRTHRPLLLGLSEKLSGVQGLIEKKLDKTQHTSPVCTDHFVLSCFSYRLTVLSVLRCHGQPVVNGNAEESGSGNHLAPDYSSPDIGDQYKDIGLWLKRLVDQQDTVDNFDIGFWVTIATRYVNGSADFIATGFGSDDFFQFLMDFNLDLLSAGPLDIHACRACVRIITQVHHHLKAYACNSKAYANPAESLTFKALCSLILELRGRWQDIDVLTSQDLDYLSETLTSAISFISEDADGVLKALSSFILDQVVELVLLQDRQYTDWDLGGISQMKDIKGLPYILLVSMQKKKNLLVSFTRLFGTNCLGSQDVRRLFAQTCLLPLLMEEDSRRTSREEKRLAAQNLLKAFEAFSLSIEAEEITHQVEPNNTILKKLEEKIEELKNTYT